MGGVVALFLAAIVSFLVGWSLVTRGDTYGVIFVAIGLMFGALGLQKWVSLRTGGSSDNGDDSDA